MSTETASLPLANADTRPFWEACARHELVYQACCDCGKPQFPPRKGCASCQSDHQEWRASKGMGTVYSFTTVYRAPTPAFKAMTPYIIALVDIDEGFRMMLDVVDCPPEGVAIGSRVRVVYRTSNGVLLPQAELVK